MTVGTASAGFISANFIRTGLAAMEEQVVNLASSQCLESPRQPIANNAKLQLGGLEFTDINTHYLKQHLLTVGIMGKMAYGQYLLRLVTGGRH